MRIKQSSNFLMALVREVASGRMLPAAMQRPYVWRKSDVEALCDSILSGFPIGSFLLWAPETKADVSSFAKGRLGPIYQASAEKVTPCTPYSLLLDGQNRLATIAWMMQREDVVDLPDASEAERETWLGDECLVLDWETRSLRFVPRSMANEGFRMPAWTVVGSITADGHSEAMRLMRSLWRGDRGSQFSEKEQDDFCQFWDDCCSCFREARTTETVIEHATPEEARHAFSRICKVGVPISVEDFDRAIGWSAP